MIMRNIEIKWADKVNTVDTRTGFINFKFRFFYGQFRHQTLILRATYGAQHLVGLDTATSPIWLQKRITPELI